MKNSGFYLKEKYNLYDAGSRGLVEDHIPAGCRCGNILLGKNMPKDCPISENRVRLPILIGACIGFLRRGVLHYLREEGVEDCENTLKHGSGGEESGRLIKDIFASVFDDEILLKMEDSAVLPPCMEIRCSHPTPLSWNRSFSKAGISGTFRLRYGE